MTNTQKRKAYGLTLMDIAKACGITKQAVQQFECGKAKNSKCEELYSRLGELHTKKYGTICTLDWFVDTESSYPAEV